MAVDYMAGVGAESERLQYAARDRFVVHQRVVRVLLFGPCGLVGYEVALERGHARLAEQRRHRSAPQIPHHVLTVAARARTRPRKIALARDPLGAVQRGAPGGPAVGGVYRQLHQRAVGVHRYAAVVQQVAVAAQVHAARREQELDVLLELFGVLERYLEPIHQFALALGQRGWVGRIDRGERVGRERMAHAVDLKRAVAEVDPLQQPAVVHAVLGVAAQQLAFELEHDYRHGLVHAGQLHVVLAGVGAAQALGHELGAGIGRIRAGGKRGQRAQRYAISHFQRVEVAVLE